jgi:D-sedoheptulose 7-phosphate isomerase
MSSRRVSKKLVPSLQGIDGAILLVNAYDPQIETIKYFLEAIEGYPHFIVLNKVDKVSVTRAQEVRELIDPDALMSSMTERQGLHGIKEAIESLPKGRIAVLGIFNSGKTSLINNLTGGSEPVGDIPGTTLVVTSHKYNDWELLDTIGDIWDTHKPLMFSIDLTGCMTIREKVDKVLADEITGLINTRAIVTEPLVRATESVRKAVESGNKVITVGAGASALVAMEMAGQGQETGVPIIPITNNMSQAQPISFAKGTAEDEGALARYVEMLTNQGDVVIGVSASGGTGFVHEALRLARQKKAVTIAITENADTPLGNNADIIIKSEAKPEGPSSSRIQVAHLAIGHALMIAVADERGITAEQSIGYMLSTPVPNKMMGIK